MWWVIFFASTNVFAQSCLFLRPDGQQVRYLLASNECVPTSSNPWAYNQCCEPATSTHPAQCSFRQKSTGNPLPTWHVDDTAVSGYSTCFVDPTWQGCNWLTMNVNGGHDAHYLKDGDQVNVETNGFKWEMQCAGEGTSDGGTRRTCNVDFANSNNDRDPPTYITVPEKFGFQVNGKTYSKGVYCVQTSF